jgi:hypothetical protein
VEVETGVLRLFIGSGRRCGVGNDQRRRCAINGPVTRRGDDGASSIKGGNEEEATTHLFLFPLDTGGRQMEARGVVARRRAVAADRRTGGRRRLGWADCAERSGDSSRQGKF